MPYHPRCTSQSGGARSQHKKDGGYRPRRATLYCLHRSCLAPHSTSTDRTPPATPHRYRRMPYPTPARLTAAGVLASRRPCPPLRPDGSTVLSPGQVAYISDAVVRDPLRHRVTQCFMRLSQVSWSQRDSPRPPAGAPLRRPPLGGGQGGRGGDAAPVRSADPPHAAVRAGQ